MPFEPPPWAADPSTPLVLKSESAKLDISKKPYYVLGREEGTVDIHLDSDQCSRNHAAIVHHDNGKVYLIDLQSTAGTFIDTERLAVHKPKQLQPGQTLTFGGFTKSFIVQDLTQSATGMADGVVRASHLLVKHKDVRRPASWKEPVVTRTPEEALAKIVEFEAQLRAGDSTTLAQRFAELAQTESHCSSARAGGDLGPFGPGKMQKAFDDGTRALEVGQLSGPIFSDSGVHLILRTL